SSRAAGITGSPAPIASVSKAICPTCKAVSRQCAAYTASSLKDKKPRKNGPEGPVVLREACLLGRRRDGDDDRGAARLPGLARRPSRARRTLRARLAFRPRHDDRFFRP